MKQLIKKFLSFGQLEWANLQENKTFTGYIQESLSYNEFLLDEMMKKHSHEMKIEIESPKRIKTSSRNERPLWDEPPNFKFEVFYFFLGENT